MRENNYISINSFIEFKFNNPQLRDISFNSFLPEFKRLKTKRSEISIEKKNNLSIVFVIKSSDITAFRASINEIISFGKIITESTKIVDDSKNK
jgi:tRNA threonylcarbamoyladenosine modification (KEOPS) complex  Pcc1 subunit